MSGFTTLVNKRALHIISTHGVLHRHGLASQAFLEYLKILLKHLTERENFLTTGRIQSVRLGGGFKRIWLSHLITVSLL